MALQTFAAQSEFSGLFKKKRKEMKLGVRLGVDLGGVWGRNGGWIWWTYTINMHEILKELIKNIIKN